MRITLDANPEGAPCAMLLTAEDGREVLVQTDFDYPGVASNLGWSPCHDGTDGTVTCRECGRTAGEMIASAAEFLRDHDGEEFEDPGYFED